MSLTIALSVAQSGLSLTEKKLSTVSSNITNADVAGYTRKTYDASTFSSGTVTIPTSGTVKSSIDYYIAKSMVAQNSSYQYATTTADYLDEYSSSYGTTDGTSSLSAQLDSLLSALQGVSAGTGQASTVVSTAQSFAAQLNSLSQSIQSQRGQADQQIDTAVDSVNQLLTTIDSLNQQIAKGGSDTADLEDKRMTALQSLSGYMGVQYYTDENNQMHIYTQGGATLVGGSTPAQLSFTAASTVNSDLSYPDDLSGITLSPSGTDITSSITGGTIGALLDLRDTTLPQEQEKLDALADTASSSLNAVLNQGASLPPRTTLTGDADTDVSDSFSGTGSVRIAITDSSGNVQSVTNLDLSSYSSVQQVVDAISAISGLSASVTDGKLTISSTDSSLGISINEMDSDVGSDGQGFSDYFGLNGLFTGSGASHIQVSQYLLDDSSALASGTLSDSATLAAGDKGIASGDTSVLDALSDALNGKQSFAVAGDFGSRQTTLSSYAATIISGAATKASTAADNETTAETTYNYYSDIYSSKTGVNIDEETANMTILQNAYEANATLIATIREMFQTLVQALQ